jgi:DNA polymerase-3 subunit alpha
MASDFAHLHVHSEYSLLDGMGRTANLAKEAKRLGQSALALTDHGVMHGAIEFFYNCKKEGIKPIIGVEAYLTPHGRSMQDRELHKDRVRHHLLLLAQNMTGYKNLLKICSDAQLQGYYYKPRIDADYLAAHAEGLICTTGCLAAEVPYLLNSEDGRPPQPEKALERLQWYIDVFGRDRFFVELQEHSIPALTEINRTLFQWSGQHNLGLLVTNDVHYVTAQDAKAHDTLLCVQTSSLINQPKRMRMSDNSYYLKSLEEMQALFRPLVDLPQSAFTNSLKIAEMCEVDLEDSSFHLPDLPPGVMPKGFTYETFLRHLTDAGLKKRYGDRANSAEIQARKEHELNIINRMGFAIYYLIVWDLCEYARRRGIWWNVRGSGAGSIVAYATGITLIDPLRHNLIFERFLNPGRISMPDFDLDYPDDQREELIRYTIKRYGSDHVAQIVSFGRMKARAAIRDVGRAMDVPLTEVDTLAKQIAAIPGKPATIDDVLDSEHEFFSSELKVQYDNVDYVQELVDYARNLEGVARHSSVHAAAVIITDNPLTEYVPVMRPQGSVITDSVTQFEFPICESIGLLKVDFLGLSTLTILRKAAELIKERHGLEFNLENIPMDNLELFKDLPDFPPPDKAFELLARGDVTGVFQVEGSGMRRVLTDMKPTKFEHIVAAISLFRPGPIEYIPTYIARMHGQEEVSFKHPKLESILAETYGIIVYQEQIIRIASELAGYAPGDADQIRKAVGKKIKAKIEEHRSKFITGAVENNIPQETAEAIYGDIEFFARYGFNKAHAADYALVTCQTAYLKAHFPIEYMTALLTVERGNTEKIGLLVGECRAKGIQVLPPNVNHSCIDFIIEECKDEALAIRFSLSAIKNVGEGPIREIMKARETEGPFKEDIDDFCDRVDLRQVGRRALEGMIKVGALDDFGPRNHLLAIIDRLINLSSSTHKANAVGQMSMFDLGGFDAPQIGSVLYPKPDDLADIPQRELLSWEKELAGTYLSNHPIQKYLPAIKAAKTTMLGELDDNMHGQQVTVAGMINFVRHHQTKKGDPMAFVEIEDIQVAREIVVFPRAYAAHKELLVNGNLIVVRGKVDAPEGRILKILADSISNEIITYGAIGEVPATYDVTPSSTLPLMESQTSSPRQQNGSHSRHRVSAALSTSTAVPPQKPVQAEPQPKKPPVPRRLRVTMQRTGDLVQDKHRLRVVYNLLTKTPGQDQFVLYIPNGNNKVQIDFPNQTTHYTAGLEQELVRMLGATAVRVD